MQVLSRFQTKHVFGGDNPSMGPYAPPITREMSNNAADRAFNSLAAWAGAATGAGIRWVGELVGITIPAVTGSTSTGGAVVTPSLLNELKIKFEDYTWDKLQIKNEQNGYNKEGTEYQWPSGVHEKVVLNDQEQHDLELAFADNLVENAENGAAANEGAVTSAMSEAASDSSWASGLAMGDSSGDPGGDPGGFGSAPGGSGDYGDGGGDYGDGGGDYGGGGTSSEWDNPGY